jgi:hypothetical protein
MNIIKFAYLAGYIDGDGCFYVRTYFQKPNNILVFDYSIQICSVDEFIIQYFTKEFGGVCSQRPEKRNDRKDSFLWTIKTKQSVVIAKEIIPFLLSKKNTCNSFIQLGDSIIPNRGISIDEIEISKRQNIIQNIKQEIHMNDKITKEIFLSLKKIKKSIEPSEEDLAYIAGLIDAEGCFRICHFQSKRPGRSRSYIPVLEIGNTKSPIFPWIINRFGGSIVYRAPTSRTHNPMIIWSLRSKALYPMLLKILPFVRVKKERCEKLIELQKTSIPNGGNRKSEDFKIRQSEIQAKRVCLVEELHKLNAKGKH